MSQRFPGSTGGPQDFTAIDLGTNMRGRSAQAGPVCTSEDPNLLQRSGYVLDAWEIAKYRYAGSAIIAHTERDFYDLIKGALPMVLAACGVLLTTTVIGAGVGSLAGGIGAIPGAVLGFAIGTELLEVLGLGFLGIYLKDRIGDIANAFYAGTTTAWRSCGDSASIEDAARQMAEAVGLFYAALLQALLLFLGSALTSRTLAASRTALRGSKLFKSCEKLEAWINKNFSSLYEKHIGKPAPGLLPPISRSLDEWSKYIQKLEIKPPPRDKGILWSRIGSNKAAELASQRGMTSLEMTLKENGFQAAYDDVFGKVVDETTKTTTKAIWKQVSAKYARSLQGRVIAFVDDQALLKAIKEARAIPREDLKPGEYEIDGPIITMELMEITDVMEQNPNISVVEIRDIANPDTTIKVMTRTQVLQSKASRPN